MSVVFPPLEPAKPVQPLCPFCRSEQVTTTSKSVSDSTYWRCHGCGQIWNPSRLHSLPRGTWQY
jgi:transposase-like protein